jgi:hypothetical protein
MDGGVRGSLYGWLSRNMRLVYIPQALRALTNIKSLHQQLVRSKLYCYQQKTADLLHGLQSCSHLVIWGKMLDVLR